MALPVWARTEPRSRFTVMPPDPVWARTWWPGWNSGNGLHKFGEELEAVVALEKVGLDVVWVAEAYSFDAISQVGYLLMAAIAFVHPSVYVLLVGALVATAHAGHLLRVTSHANRIGRVG